MGVVGRPRPFGMLPWRGREAARRDHLPQLVYELMTRDTSRSKAGRVKPPLCSGETGIGRRLLRLERVAGESSEPSLDAIDPGSHALRPSRGRHAAPATPFSLAG